MAWELIEQTNSAVSVEYIVNLNLLKGTVNVISSNPPPFFNYTVKPQILNTSKDFLKCRLDSFSMGFIRLYLDLSYCKNK